MEALHRLGGARFEIFSTGPRWLFDESIPGLYTYHEVATDVGFRQRSALAFDLPATVAAIEAMLPFDEARVDSLARIVAETGCRAVLCDIAPLGVAVAERAGVPSLLVENFTWPWLYEPLFAEAPALEPLAEEMRIWFDRATWHVQTEPLCELKESSDLHVPPIGRRARTPRDAVRRALGIGADARAVLLMMGGIPEDLPFLDRLGEMEAVEFLITGAPQTRVRGNLHLFDHGERLYLPDLVRGSDAVVGKLGYSTVAEVWGEGRPLAYVTRSDFRETEPVRRWVDREMSGFEVAGDDFAGGEWTMRIPELLDLGGAWPHDEGGAESVARFLLERLGR
jgi:hypothetical protein